MSTLFFCLLFLLISWANCQCDEHCVTQSKVTYFSDSAIKSGACGYGFQAEGFNGGYVAAAIPSIYNDGAGCGACFQEKIRCKNPKLCTEKGTTVTVTDLHKSNRTDFVMSSRAFTAMAQKSKAADLKRLGLVDVEYKRWVMGDGGNRVPCVYQNKKNLWIRVEEYSKRPDYLAFTFLYQGGQTEILVVDVIQMDTLYVNSASRNYGAVWDVSGGLSGELGIRFAVMGGYDAKWYTFQLPTDYNNSQTYDTGLTITDKKEDGCSSCRDWN